MIAVKSSINRLSQLPLMSRRRLLRCCFILSILAVGVGIYHSRRTPQVVWRGKPSTYWISRLTLFDLDNPSGVSAEEFLFAAGPEVVPELIHGLSLRDNWMADRWTDIYFKLGKWQHFFPSPIKRANYRQNCAMGLGLLGAAASAAEPALLKALNDKDSFVRSAAAQALGRIAADKSRVVPSLVAGLGSQDQGYRLACIIGLTHCLPGTSDAAKPLRAMLQDPDFNKRAWAADSLWQVEAERDATFSALVQALQDQNAVVRDRAAQSIGKMHYNPDRSTEVLRVALDRELAVGGNEIVVWKILGALAEIGPAARLAVPDLKDLTQTNNHAATLAVIALGRIEPENPQWIEQLVNLLDHGEEGAGSWAAWELGKRIDATRKAVEPLRRLAEAAGNWQRKAIAATAAWRLDASSPNPLSLITNKLSKREYGNYEIVRLLGELGPVARPALPTLLQLRYSRGIMMHDYANESIGKIAPEYLTNPWQD